MKRNILNKLFIAGCLLAMVSCKAKKVLVAAPTAAAPVATVKPVNPMEAVKAAQLTFNTFSAKADAKLDVDGDSNDVDLTIRINHGKEIWVSVSKTVLISFELARVVITPDSILLINKLQSVYLRKPFSYIYAYSNKKVSYKMLEAILVGNAIPEIINDNNANFQTNGGNTTLSGTLEDLVYTLMLGNDKKVGQFNLSNHNEGQSMQVNNGVFMPAGDKTAPSQIDIQSTAQNKKILVNLHYTKIDLDQPLQYPFSIPERYTPADGN
jgi:hypothetical protein